MIRICQRSLVLMVVVLLLGGCIKSTRVVSEWQADRNEIDKRERIAVIAMMPEALQRLTIEQEIVRVMRKSGRNALVSSDIPGLAGRLSRQRVEPALKAASVDAIIVVFIASGGKGEPLERSDYYVAQVDSGFYGYGYGWFAPTYTNVYTVREDSGYYAGENYIYVETTYFDIIDDRAKWSMITRSKDIGRQDAASGVAKKIIAKMKSSGTM